MGFTHSHGSGRMADMVAEITNIGFDYQKYKDGEEHRLILVLTPQDKDKRVQTDWISTGAILKLSGEKQTVTVGAGNNAWDINIVGDVVEQGNLEYKVSVWLDKLEILKIPVPSETGDFKELLGLKAKWRQVTFNEALGRKAKDNEKPFWIPIEMMELPKKRTTLKTALLQNADGKTEDKIAVWYEQSEYYTEGVTAPLYAELDALVASGEIVKDIETKRYIVKKE